MLKKFLVVCLCFPLIGHTAEFWSMGSFGKEANANVERDRIIEETALAARVTFDGDLYRVVVEKDDNPSAQKRQIEGAGISPWTFNMGEEQAAVKTAVNGSGGFVLVIAGFENTEPARTLVQELSAAGVPNVGVHKGTVSGSDYYRVVQGPHQSKDESARQELIDRGYEDAWWLASDMVPVQKTVKIAAMGWNRSKNLHPSKSR